MSKHTTAKPSHYDNDASSYDALNEDHSKIINSTIEKILKKHSAKSVLDMTCGTGSQVFWLNKAGFEVTGSDISAKMLERAKSKALQTGLDLNFIEGDIRNLQVGKFDAAITIFNAIGHLTKADFELAIRNIYNNLNPGGLYIFDINNLEYLLHQDNITKLTIDWLKQTSNGSVRKIQYSTISNDGVLASYTTTCENETISNDKQTLQVYSAKQLTKMLENSGFKVIDITATDGKVFSNTESDQILITAQRGLDHA